MFFILNYLFEYKILKSICLSDQTNVCLNGFRIKQIIHLMGLMLSQVTSH